MKKNGFTITLLSVALCMSMLSGCGKEKVTETAILNTEEEDIFAQEGEITEKKVEETVPEVSVDSRALLKDALKGITAVRMNTMINVDALPTSTKTEDTSSLLPNDTEIVSDEDMTEKEDKTITDNVSEEQEVTEETSSDKDIESSDTEAKDTKKEEENKKESKDAVDVKENETKKESDATYDKNHSALDVASTDTKNNGKSETKTTKLEETVDNAEDEDIESEEPEKPVYVPTDESTYYINMKVSTDMDTTKAKNYGRLRMNLGAVIDKEIASYTDYSVEPAVDYTIKYSMDLGADDEGNSTEEVVSKWYTSDSTFYGIATIKEILENSDIVSYNESVDSHIIGITVDKTLAEKLDVTHDIMDILFKGKDTVSMTCYISKADGILTRIVITMTDFKGTALSKVEVQTNNYIITFEKYNSINKVMIPDTILGGALEITGEENFLSDEDLVKYNFEKLAVEQEMADTLEEEKEQVEVSDTDNTKEKTETTKDEKEDTKESDTESADDALKATQNSKKK